MEEASPKGMGRLFSSSVLNEEPQGDDDDGHLVGQFKPIGPGSARCLHRGGNGMNDDEDKGNLEQKDWQENHLLMFDESTNRFRGEPSLQGRESFSDKR
jgi:hypothetical protein